MHTFSHIHTLTWTKITHWHTYSHTHTHTHTFWMHQCFEQSCLVLPMMTSGQSLGGSAVTLFLVESKFSLSPHLWLFQPWLENQGKQQNMLFLYLARKWADCHLEDWSTWGSGFHVLCDLIRELGHFLVLRTGLPSPPDLFLHPVYGAFSPNFQCSLGTVDIWTDNWLPSRELDNTKASVYGHRARLSSVLFSQWCDYCNP